MHVCHKTVWSCWGRVVTRCLPLFCNKAKDVASERFDLKRREYQYDDIVTCQVARDTVERVNQRGMGKVVLM